MTHAGLPTVAAFALLLLGLGPVHSANRGHELDQVLVEARRDLSKLRDDIARLEDAFYARYNELNAIDDFDVYCAKEVRTGTRIGKRSCRAVYESKALQEEGAESFKFRQFVNDQLAAGRPDPITMGGPPVQAIVAIEMRRPDFRKHLREVVAGNPELVKSLEEREKLIERYHSVRQKTAGRAEAP